MAAQGAGVSPSFFFFVLFFFLPLSLNSLARCPSGTSCARLLTHPRQHRAGTRVKRWIHMSKVTQQEHDQGALGNGPLPMVASTSDPPPHLAHWQALKKY